MYLLIHINLNLLSTSAKSKQICKTIFALTSSCTCIHGKFSFTDDIFVLWYIFIFILHYSCHTLIFVNFLCYAWCVLFNIFTAAVASLAFFFVCEFVRDDVEYFLGVWHGELFQYGCLLLLCESCYFSANKSILFVIYGKSVCM